MREGKAKVGDLELHYEDHGRETDPAILLIMGLGAQLIWWPDALVDALVAKGFRVIRHDNRDIGLSTKLAHLPPPGARALMATAFLGRPLATPYTLEALAADAVGVLDHLGIAQAHIVGASMGGMIAQIFAATYPERVLSLTSIMSTSGRKELKKPALSLQLRMLKRRQHDAPRATKIAEVMNTLRLIGSPDQGAQVDAERAALATRAVDRSFYPDGARRQLGAIIASGDRVAALGRITAPTLVIHGTADRLVPPDGGEDTARLILGARLEMIPGMGHDLPGPLVPRIADLIAEHATAATATKAAA
ncbi:Aclacinomycin methylesterase RdmC [Sphingomonas antarctica]|uniref:alpha/beta fold hydrolase n=1 Tax=Sphingomonas antarctica TaxID=2040274 RepID=UPI0039EAE439